jgi:hypothetical protein
VAIIAAALSSQLGRDPAGDGRGLGEKYAGTVAAGR